MVVVPKVKLNNGLEMPVIGLGTFNHKGDAIIRTVKHAIDVGYRLFDTAYYYGNEKEVGQAIKAKIAEGVVKREDLFITTKLWNTYHDPDKVEINCRKSLKNLGLEYVDLYLMHFPIGHVYINEDTLLPTDSDGKLLLSDVDYLDTYNAMEELVKKGLTKSIGISNFNFEQTERVVKNSKIKPVINQIECHAGLNQRKLINFSKDRNIIISSYIPLARPNMIEKTPAFMFDDKLIAIGKKYKKTQCQVVLRYLIDIGTIPIPGSLTKEENVNLFDFKLTEEELKTIESLHTGERIAKFLPIKELNHKDFPFNYEF